MVDDASPNLSSANEEQEPKGNCFKAAYDLINEMAKAPEARLVHGNVGYLQEKEEPNHAWVEKDGVVFDYSNKNNKIEQSKDAYYREHEITAPREYTYLEAVGLAGKEGNYGPWSD